MRNPATPPDARVLNSPVAGRELAKRSLGLQLAATLATALAWLLSGPQAALSALAGGLGLTLGTLAAAWGAFGGGVRGGGERLARLLLGIAGKWIIVALALFLAMAVWKLPAVPALVGAAMAAMALLLAGRTGQRMRA